MDFLLSSAFWVVAGLFLLAIETLVPLMLFTGFGLGALSVSAILIFLPTPFGGLSTVSFSLVLAIYWVVFSLIAWKILQRLTAKGSQNPDINDFDGRPRP